MFSKNIDQTNREEMIRFLSDHFKYHTYNSWNNQKSFAHNVKIQNINVPDNAFDIIQEGTFYGEIEALYFKPFADQFKGHTISFNGSHSGYVVLYSDNSAFYNLDESDFEKMETDDLTKMTNVVCAFDKVIDNVREELIHYCNTYYVKEVEVPVVKTQMKLFPKSGWLLHNQSK